MDDPQIELLQLKVKKYVKKEDKGKIVIFRRNNNVVGIKSVLIMAFFPPCNANNLKMHDNRINDTSREIIKIMKNSDFVWNDFFPYSPNKMDAINQTLILYDLRKIGFLQDF